MSSAISAAWTNSAIGDDGTMTTNEVTPAVSTIKRQRGVKQLQKLAAKQNVPIDTVVTNVLSQAPDELSNYVMYHGETPVTDPVGLAVQAALIRLSEVGNISKVCDCSDDQALLYLEQHEQDAKDSGSYDVNQALSPAVQSALAVVMQHASSVLKCMGSTGDAKDAMPDLNSAVQGMLNTQVVQAKRANGIDDSSLDMSDLEDPTDFISVDQPDVSAAISDTGDFEVPSLIPVSNTLEPVTSGTIQSPTVPVPVLSNASQLPQVTPASVVQAQVANATSGTVSAGGVMNALTTIGNVISSAAKSASSIATSAGVVGKAVNQVGANSLQVWIQQHMGEVFIGAIALFVIIYFATRKSIPAIAA